MKMSFDTNTELDSQCCDLQRIELSAHTPRMGLIVKKTSLVQLLKFYGRKRVCAILRILNTFVPPTTTGQTDKHQNTQFMDALTHV